MLRLLMVAYALAAYMIFFAVNSYMIAFTGDFLVPKTLATGGDTPPLIAFAVNTGLILMFAAQHSIMARPSFKAWWTRVIPKPIERATYVLVASLVIALMMALWQPLPQTLWHLEGPASYPVWALFGLGWNLVFASSFLINHFHLFGLQQVTQALRRKPLTDPPYKEFWLYTLVRHPLMLGFVIAFWSATHMTVSHLQFATLMTIYILAALKWEERDLLKEHGEKYENYRRRVPMLVPLTKPRPKPEQPA